MKKFKNDNNSRVPLLVASLATLMLASSCAPLVSPPRLSGTGTIVVSLGGSTGSRADTSAPPLPLFSSATLIVSGAGFNHISVPILIGISIPITVPAGIPITVTVDAVPNWTASAIANPGKSLPILAKRYSGTTTITAEKNKSISVAISLKVSETKILLPSIEP
ncbi:hypothetical protein MASR2M78_33240 [Treponema sp.]